MFDLMLATVIITFPVWAAVVADYIAETLSDLV